LRAALAAAILLGGGTAHGAGFDIAITADDLTVHGALPPGQTWPGIARAYIAALKAHGVPEAYGFVNAKRIEETPASEPVLDLWRAAGYPLGNHTYSHLGLSRAPSLEAWEEDAKRGEPAIAKRMQGQDWHVLRYPFLDAGNTPARHDGALAWLQKEGYRIADVSISFDDWAYTDPYARCLAMGDAAGAAALKTDYLRRVDEAIARMPALSRRVYGRVIPQVLLTHLGAFSAATLPDVLRRLDAAGAHYVTLAQAQADPAYSEPSPQSGNGALMERRAADAHIDLAGLPPLSPAMNLDAACR
jgi:peptidoglycan/xylan/chitin deacetylase (PgdA/CDA1 family)